mmetsp:Transcript_96345/g.155445  ORF Transcript_96345/g.155445 Transcript_96345/m.155445 type:complete len:230 (-) Transcript_96345:112-801(-)
MDPCTPGTSSSLLRASAFCFSSSSLFCSVTFCCSSALFIFFDSLSSISPSFFRFSSCGTVHVIANMFSGLANLPPPPSPPTCESVSFTCTPPPPRTPPCPPISQSLPLPWSFNVDTAVLAASRTRLPAAKKDIAIRTTLPPTPPSKFCLFDLSCDVLFPPSSGFGRFASNRDCTSSPSSEPACSIFSDLLTPPPNPDHPLEGCSNVRETYSRGQKLENRLEPGKLNRCN